MDSLTKDDDVLATAATWLDEGRDLVLATVVSTWGSAPRPAGSQLLIDGDGNFEGSVSGGCVEGAVVVEALDVIKRGAPKLLEFGVADETAWRVGLSCGGKIAVYLQPVGQSTALDASAIAALSAARVARRPTAVLTDLRSGAVRVVGEGADIPQEARAHFQSGESGIE